jgi:formiminotetrahydrofolate cyclodeaminase
MEPSVWTGTLDSLREKVGGTDPVPAGVAISAVGASLAFALLAKVLAITGNRKTFTGNKRRIEEMLAMARLESERLARLADEDVAAYHLYLELTHEKREEEAQAAMRKAIEVPLDAAQSGVRGLDLCAEAVDLVSGALGSDLRVAESLLRGAVRALLATVQTNIGEMHSDQAFSEAVMMEWRKLELKTG